MATRKAVVLGAGGFVGGELLRLLATHPHLELAAAVSESSAGRVIGDVYPDLDPWIDLQFISFGDWDPDVLGGDSWTVFSAMGHGDTMKRLPQLVDMEGAGDLQVIDLSGDFRLQDDSIYEQAYGRPHAHPDLLSEFVYGLAEVNRPLIIGSDRVANPGCFATAIGLALAPAAGAGWGVRCVAVDGMTGSSGAGVKPGPTTHHPRRAHNIEAYRPLEHQHLPEIVQTWQSVGDGSSVPISFVPHRTPLVRGIAASCHLFVDPGVDAAGVSDRYRSYYAGAPFIRILDQPPAVVDVWGSNRCDLAIVARDGVVSVCSAIDNLVKGAAGQAIQNANLMNRWDETSGLQTPMPTPI